MIRSRRGAEPPPLTATRRWRLARLRLDWIDWIEAGNDPDDPARVRAFVDDHAALLNAGYDDPAHVIRNALRTGSGLKSPATNPEIRMMAGFEQLCVAAGVARDSLGTAIRAIPDDSRRHPKPGSGAQRAKSGC